MPPIPCATAVRWAIREPMSESTGWAGKGLLGCGALLLLLCTARCLIWGFHVYIDPRGAISDDELLTLRRFGALDETRKKAAGEARDAIAKRRAGILEKAKDMRPIHPGWVSHCISKIKDDRIPDYRGSRRSD